MFKTSNIVYEIDGRRVGISCGALVSSMCWLIKTVSWILSMDDVELFNNSYVSGKSL